jgi:hypothetical protein
MARTATGTSTLGHRWQQKGDDDSVLERGAVEAQPFLAINFHKLTTFWFFLSLFPPTGHPPHRKKTI